MANCLPHNTRALIISQLCEGMGIRNIERVAGVHRDTIMRLGRDVGEGCARLHDALFVRLAPERVELDEAWSYVFKKQGRLQADDSREYGDQYSFIALDAENKAILAYHVGKRNKPNTIGFALDLASRIVTKPQITSDGYEPYRDAIVAAFGADAKYAMLVKQYQSDCAAEAARRFTPAEVTGTKRIVVSGEPEYDDINTAFVERQNLTLRMLTRRFNRLTNAHSKTLRNHRAAFDLYVGYYNLCWRHATVKVTPAQAMGVVSKPWTVEQLVGAALELSDPDDPPVRPGDVQYARYLLERQRGKRRY